MLADSGFKVTVIADSFEPSASAAAAAMWFPYAIPPEAEEWAHQSFDRLIEIAAVRGSGVSLVDFDVLSQNPASDIPEWAERHGAVPLSPSECVPYRTGIRVNVPLMDTRIYLPWLRAQVAHRTERVPTKVGSLSDLVGYDLVVNCSGHRAASLHGAGPKMDPRRGIVIRIPNPGISRAAVFAEDPDQLMYVVPRGDDVVLGGTYEPTDDEHNCPADVGDVIMDRCRRFEPLLAGVTFNVNDLAAGIRPVAERVCLGLDHDAAPFPVVHNYGHGGSGYTVSWGCAAIVLKCIRQMFSVA